jgi:hypothetical protein
MGDIGLLASFIYEMLLPYATPVRGGDEFPKRSGVFKVIPLVENCETLLYVILRVPSYAWEFDYSADEYGWHQRVLTWSPHWGFQVWYQPCTTSALC